ncbi:MAG TPA: hypothetical protein EYN91_01595 [Candidatus Melainabacteria bacterium]|jgi:hypothetical protein|nr:hypothetical protein [Candidatus Melainabacteria bacterium]
MNRFWQSFFYGLIVTISIMGPAFGLGVLWTIGTGGDATAYAVDCIKLAFVVMIFSTWGLYELAGLMERANRPRNRDGENGDGTNRDDRNTGQPDDKTDDKNRK